VKTVRNLITLIHEAAERHAARPALSWKEDGRYIDITYAEFWKRIQSFAYALQQFGVHQGTKVAILSNNRSEWTISDVAILSLGAVTVPIYHTLTPPQIEYILNNADVELIVVENEELASKVRSVAPAQLHTIIVMDPTGLTLQPGVVSYREMIAQGADLLAAKGPLTTWLDVAETDLATIVHTSGTTGNPKGVMLTHGNLVANIEGSTAFVPISEQDRTLCYLPLAHIFERTAGQFVALVHGACISFAENLNTIATNLLEVRPTMMNSVPRLYEKIYDGIHKTINESSKFKQWLFHFALQTSKRQKTTPTLTSRLLHPLLDKLVFAKIRSRLGGNIRLLGSGGAALAPDIAEFFHYVGLTICEGYGMTETSPVISINPTADTRVGTVGRPLANLQVRIAPDGELLVKGPSVMVGYYKNPEATRSTLDEDGWLHTGDIAELVDGYLKIVERKKNILVLATGKNVAPFPIESAMARSPYISQAVLFGDKRKFVTALLVPDFANLKQWADSNNLGHLTPEELLRHPQVQSLYEQEISEQLREFAPFEKPKKFTLLPTELTLEDGALTVTLKVRHHVLFKRYEREIESMYADSDAVAAT
jgi:long-chain acyl-CoA synthetase